MSFPDYLEKNKNIQNSLLVFLENEADSEEDYLILRQQIDKIKNRKYELILFLHMLSKISENHDRRFNLIAKVEQLLQYLELSIK